MGLKKKNNILSNLINIASNLRESAQFYSSYKLNTLDDVKHFANKMKEFETKGDNYVHTTITDLNNIFITPIEREDILSLAMHMDDVLDGLEHTAAMFEMYSIINADEFMLQFVEKIEKCTFEVEKAVHLLLDKKLQQMREHSIKIKDYESKCDDILLKSIKHLFQVEKDPIKIMQYKEIYEELEEIADYCQNVANTFDTIIMKNA